MLSCTVTPQWTPEWVWHLSLHLLHFTLVSILMGSYNFTDSTATLTELSTMLVILQVQVQKVFLSNVHCIQSIPLALTLPENGWRRVSLLVFFHEKLSDRRSYVITSYFIKNGLGDSVWKAFTPCGLTCTAISRLVANLVLFLRLLTCQFTVLHCYLSARAKCAAWLPVQYKIYCIRKLYGDVQQLTLLHDASSKVPLCQ